MSYLKRYWKQITGIATALTIVFGWLWEIKTREDNYLNIQNQLVTDVKSLKEEVTRHDQKVDNLDHRVIPLEVKEDLREKGLLK